MQIELHWIEAKMAIEHLCLAAEPQNFEGDCTNIEKNIATRERKEVETFRRLAFQTKSGLVDWMKYTEKSCSWPYR